MKEIPYGPPQSLVDRLRIRANIRRNAIGRDLRPDGNPDRLTALLEEAADSIDQWQQFSLDQEEEIRSLIDRIEYLEDLSVTYR